MMDYDRWLLLANAGSTTPNTNIYYCQIFDPKPFLEEVSDIVCK